MAQADDGLLDHIYDAVVDDRSFASLPQALAAKIGTDAAWLLADVDLAKDAMPPAALAASGIDADLATAYLGGGYRIDPWMQAASRMAPGVATAMDRFVSREAFVNSTLYNDYVRGRSSIGQCLSIAFPVAGRMHGFAMLRDMDGPLFGLDEERDLDVLSVHLKRLLYSRRRRGEDRQQQIGGRILDTAPDAIFACDRRGRLAYCNQAAARMAMTGTGVVRLVSGNLVVEGPERGAFARAVGLAIDRHVSTMLPLLGSGDGSVRLRIDPDRGEGGLALVTVRDVALFLDHQIGMAAERCGFTPAERALATGLLKGRTIEQHAADRGSRPSTVRTQLNALFAKTGTQRQGQLIALLLTDPPPCIFASDATIGAAIAPPGTAS